MRVSRARWWTAVGAVVVAAGLSSGARAEVVELKALEKRALERHFSLRAGDARTRAAEAGVREAKSGYMPHVGLNVDSNLGPGRQILYVRGGKTRADAESSTHSQTIAVQGVAVGTQNGALLPYWRSTANLVLGTNLYDFGRTAAAVAASRAKYEAASAEQELTRAQVVSNVRQAYLSWLSSHELHRLSSSGSEDSARRTERVNALIQEGARPRGDFAPVESDRLLSELELERSVGELESARMLLEATVGEPLPANAEPDLNVLEVRVDASVTPKVDPSLRMLAYQRAATAATARMQRKAGAPVISASAAAGVGVQTKIDENTFKALPSYAVGLGLSVPIWDGGGSRAGAAATEARADELRIRLESAEVDRHQERARARLDAQHAQNREATALKLVEICKTRVADTEAGYELGAMQFDQVQQARSMLRRAETEVVLAKVARAEAVLRFAP
ncbi:MAG: outer rane efflux protein [Myxococcaceae bacterium]|nr:outer rane efflux protein [Myxococcaceae bacterium]